MKQSDVTTHERAADGSAPGVLAQPLRLPCGAILSNRLAKAPLTEGLADAANRANSKHVTLYRRWSEGGAGLLISGNVQVDRRYLERAGNVVMDGDDGIDQVRAYASAGTTAGNHFWMQINHPGRQAAVAREGTLLAPSAIRLEMTGLDTIVPRAMTEAEILDVIRRFGQVATAARDCGFTGVQVHAAHGYLLSQFLSGRTNIRTDAWGGALENRARLLLETVRAVRRAVGHDFPVSVKLNSADFQKGGFTSEDCVQVVRWLGEEKIDLLEVSGGTYEQYSMLGAGGEDETAPPLRASTAAREGYFLDYVGRIRGVSTIPIMITGGMRSRAGMEYALSQGGADVIGLGRPMCVDTDICRRLLTGEADAARRYETEKVFDPAALGPDATPELARVVETWSSVGWFYVQLWRLGAGQEADRGMSRFDAYTIYRETEQRMTEALLPL